MTFSASFDDRGFTAALEAAAALSIGQLKPELETLGVFLRAEVDSEFEGARDPYGNKWAPLAAITVTDKRARGSPNAEAVLQDIGKLRRSFQAEVTDEGLSLFTDRVFPDGMTAEIHQFGGTHPRSNAFIPAREMLPFSRELPPEWLQHVEILMQAGADRIFK